ncbi:MAG: ribonuclease P protein subunit [Candidatus Woesearchaeota archaeon]
MNAATREIIGAKAKITSSTNKSTEGIQGIIIDETKNMISIRTISGDKKIIKKASVFEIDGERISGDELVGRPEERIKRWIRK